MFGRVCPSVMQTLLVGKGALGLGLEPAEGRAVTRPIPLKNMWRR